MKTDPEQLQSYIGRRFTALIGEPWDFESEDGEGRLSGVIVDAGEIHGKAMLFARCSGFKHSENRVTAIAIGSRYTSGFEDPDTLPANMFFHKNGEVISMDSFPPPPSDRISWLIGTARFE